MAAEVESIFGPEYKKISVGDVVNVAVDKPMRLDCGREISNFPLAYQTYGTLNADKSNAILVCHGLTGDQYLANKHPVTGKDGWWENIVGPGEILDTDKYFIICSNVLGGCMGSLGPKSINPETKKPYNLDFPVITIADMVRAQVLLIDHFGIDQLFSVIGGSMGAMLTLEWAAKYPERVFSASIIAGAARHVAQNIAFHEIGRQTIVADPNWCGGNYLNKKKYPSSGLAVGRMTAHVTYLSESGLHRKFGRGLQDRDEITYGFDADFQIESYLRYQGFTFVDRFDPNSYLYITRAMDYFDLIEENGGVLARAFEGTKTRFCVMSFSSDWLFPTSEAKLIVHALNAASAKVSFVEVETDKGHDAFLLDEPEFYKTLEGFIKGASEARGL
ncbi:homoserine O-acetyltransferase [Rickettsiales bacterium]|nr:homoserine O-acetyltransferase [Rickettsiales bacterium]